MTTDTWYLLFEGHGHEGVVEFIGRTTDVARAYEHLVNCRTRMSGSVNIGHVAMVTETAYRLVYSPSNLR